MEHVASPIELVLLALPFEVPQLVAPVALTGHSVIKYSHFLSVHRKPFGNVFFQGDLDFILGGVKAPTVLDVTVIILVTFSDFNGHVVRPDNTL